jgi:uncharacterized protein (DUF2384 family)
MSSTVAELKTALDPEQTLSKAISRAANELALSGLVLSKTLWVSQSTVSRLHAGDYLIKQGHKEWELGPLVIRLYRSLLSIVGDQHSARVWMLSPNTGLGAAPKDLIVEAEGLVSVVNYLDGFRAQI